MTYLRDQAALQAAQERAHCRPTAGVSAQHDIEMKSKSIGHTMLTSHALSIGPCTVPRPRVSGQQQARLHCV